MEVKIGNKKFALAKRERGWWSAAVEEAGPGTGLWIRDRWPGTARSPILERSGNPTASTASPASSITAAFPWSDSDWQAPASLERTHL